MSVYFTHSGSADHHIEKCTKHIPIVGGDFFAEVGPDHGTECISVGRCTHNEGNKRGDWMKHWLIVPEYTALNTMYRKTLQKQTTFIYPKGYEKQIDYILTKRRYLRYNKDAEANDMIHMGSGHRCVMATFTITTPGKKSHYKIIKRKTQYNKRMREELRSPSSKKIPRDHRKNQNRK